MDGCGIVICQKWETVAQMLPLPIIFSTVPHSAKAIAMWGKGSTLRAKIPCI